METPGALNRSPIREAVLDVFVEGVKVSARDLQAFGKRLGDDFPTEHVSHFVSANFAVEDGEPKTSARLVERGYQYRSPDERDVLQARIDGFSINRLASYTSGDRLFELARRWWAIYLEVAQPEAIRGVALPGDTRCPPSLDTRGRTGCLRTEVVSACPRMSSGPTTKPGW